MMGLFRTLSGVDTLWFTQNQSCLISYLSKEILRMSKWKFTWMQLASDYTDELLKKTTLKS